MASRFTFIHTADLHLGRAFCRRASTEKDDVSARLRDAQIKTWRNIVDLALEKGAAFLLLAGDVFDSEKREDIAPSTVIEFVRGLERLAGARPPVRVFIAPGNHDPFLPKSIWKSLALPDGVEVFDSIRPRMVELDAPAPVTIAGAGHTRREVRENLAASVRVPEDQRFHIAVVHVFVAADRRLGGQTDAELARYAPCAVEDFANRGVHYWALGHIHQHRFFEQRSAPPLVALYPGCPQGLDPSETGSKGVFCVEVTALDGGFEVDVEFEPVAAVEWVDVTADVTGVETPEEIEGRLAEACGRSMPEGRAAMVRIRASGAVPNPGNLRSDSVRNEIERALQEELGALDVELHLDVAPAMALDELERRENVLGQLLRRIRTLESAGPDEWRPVIEALRGDLLAVRGGTDDELIAYLKELLPEVRRESLALLAQQPDA